MSSLRSPLEDDDLLGEILLRLPPQPSSLPRASLVCKGWRSLASDPGFFRRFRRHHRRNPPLLGFFNVFEGLSFVPTMEAPNRVPPARFALQDAVADPDRFISFGCRHGLVLIYDLGPKQMLVWDPVTGDQHRLDMPPGIDRRKTINGAVLRPAGEVDHFQVVLAVTDNDDKQHRRALACVYSSQSGVWGDLISTPLPSEVQKSHRPTVILSRPAVLAQDSLYWILVGNFTGILEFDLAKQSLAVIRVPVHMLEPHCRFWIMRAEGGGLGLLLDLDSRCQLWKRKTTDSQGVASWGVERTIELDKLFSLDSLSPIKLGFAEENKVVFLWESGMVFMIHLESLQFKKLFETDIEFRPGCHPFESLYTTDIGSGHDGADRLTG